MLVAVGQWMPAFVQQGGAMDQVAPNWWYVIILRNKSSAHRNSSRCVRAKTIQSVLGRSRCQISTGVGQPANIYVALHDYNLDANYLTLYVDAAKAVIASGQRLLYEEFGAIGGNKQSDIQSITETLNSVRDFLYRVKIVTENKAECAGQTGVPWMYWELS